MKHAGKALQDRAFLEKTKMAVEEPRAGGLERGNLAEQRKAVIEALEIYFDTVPSGFYEELEGISDQDKLRNPHRAAI